jgi:hypothetical protein
VASCSLDRATRRKFRPCRPTDLHFKPSDIHLPYIGSPAIGEWSVLEIPTPHEIYSADNLSMFNHSSGVHGELRFLDIYTHPFRLGPLSAYLFFYVFYLEALGVSSLNT